MGWLAGGWTAAWGWDGHQSAGGEELHCSSLALYVLLLSSSSPSSLSSLSSLFPFLFCPFKLSSSQPPRFYYFFFFLPDSHPCPPCRGREEGRSNQLCGAELPAWLNHNKEPSGRKSFSTWIVRQVPRFLFIWATKRKQQNRSEEEMRSKFAGGLLAGTVGADRNATRQ